MTANDPINDPINDTVATTEPAATVVAPETPLVVTRQTTTTGPGGAELGRRIAVFLFGLVQVVVGLRVLLLLVDAREGNALVSGILNISQIFVAPFDGILHVNALQSGGSIFDMAAIVALVGWTVLEMIVLWALGVFRRESA